MALSAQTGAVITASTPTFMVIFAWLLLHERVTRAKVVSLILATTGVLIIVGVHFTGAHVLTGCLFLIIAALTWALMSVINKMVAPQYDVLEITTAAAIVAIICLTPLSSPTGRPRSVMLTSASLRYGGPSSTLGRFRLPRPS